MDLTQIALYTILIILIYVIYMMRVFVSVEKKMLSIDQNIEHVVNNLADEFFNQEEDWEEILKDIRPPKRVVIPTTNIGRRKITYPNLMKDIEPHHYFILKSGQVLKDISELIHALKGMSKEEFEHHVSQDNNDFANWVRHVYQEEHLADKIAIKSNKKDIKNILEKAHKKQ